MELRTEAVDRLLESIAPALAAELERATQELRRQLEAEFESRLQESNHLNAVRMEEGLARAREQVREAMSQQADEAMAAAFANWSAERTQLQEQLSRWHAYAEAQRILSECTSQPEILVQFLKLSEPFAAALAIYTSKPDGLALWRVRGGGVFPENVSSDAHDPDLYFKPVVVRGRTVAAVCAERPCKVEALDFLASCFERAVEAFGLKLQSRLAQAPVAEKAASL